MEIHLLSLSILLPVVGAIAQLTPSRFSAWFGLLMSISATVVSFALLLTMQTGVSELQFREFFPWVGTFSITYSVGLNGLNLGAFLLIAVAMPVLILSEFRNPKGRSGLFGLLLILQSTLVGLSVSQDLFLMFFFWALASLPFYFLIAVWGFEGRQEAASRYVLTTTFSNVLFFSAAVLLYFSVQPNTFSMSTLGSSLTHHRTIHLFGYELNMVQGSFWLFFASLVMRVPIWPLNQWATKVIQQSSDSVGVAFFGVYIPVSIAVFVRITYEIFPTELEHFRMFFIALAAINILYGGIAAISHTELRGLWSSVVIAQVGLLLLGMGSIDEEGVSGAVFQGLSIGLGFCGFGLIHGFIRQRQSLMGKLASGAPFLAFFTAMTFASILGIPGLSGFVGQALIMMGGFATEPVLLFVIGLGLMFLTYSFFNVYRVVFFGADDEGQKPNDLSLIERICFFPIVASILVIGIYPKPLLDIIRPSVSHIMAKGKTP